ncbi:MAG TPA: amidohydrolase family protein [Kofleriaceae bacterium]|nr:amidohydrolase family protein [Kofleriaceae bacterium]
MLAGGWLAALLLALPACSGAPAPARPAAPSSPGASPAPAPHATLAFRHVRVFDGERTLPDATVLVDGERIVAVGAGLAGPTVPAGATVIDGRGKTLLPGLIDAHVHVFQNKALEQGLAFGVTTMLDMFSVPAMVKQLRADPSPDHADLRSAGILATAPGGHGTEYGLDVPTLTRPDEAEAWVDARIAEGSDYIKIVFDDGRAYKHPIPTLDTPTFAAVVSAAHHRGKLAVVHIGDRDHARLAIDHGADGLVHLFRDRAPEADFGAHVAAHHAFVTPTIVVTQGLYGEATQLGKDPAIAPFLSPDALGNLEASFRLRAVGEPGVIGKAIAQLRDAGATILCGTDAANPGTAYGASMHEELALLVAAGLTPAAALTAATAAPAARFGLSDRGRIAPGLRADLLLVEGDPTTDILETRRIAGIWRGGHRFDREAYRARLAEAAVIRRPTVELGLVSDFERGAGAAFGHDWMVSAMAPSKAAIAVVAGAHASHGALSITGELVPGGFASWAGAMWTPGAEPFEPVDLSGRPGFSFLARGDGKPYAVMVFTRRRGRIPSIQRFQPGAAFAPVRFTWNQFDGTDGGDVTAIFIGQATAPGAFALTIDDLALP